MAATTSPKTGKLRQRKVADLKPYKYNAREHSPEQVAQIAASIERFGFNNPVLVDATGVVVAGHGRLEAAKLLGMEKVPTFELGHLSATERRAYTLADNRIAENATWNEDLLQRELSAVMAGGVDGMLLGFSSEDMDRLLADAAGEGDKDPDAAPPVDDAAPPITRAGDVWLLGEHRLMCGDSTVEADVRVLLNGEKPHLMVTDPPYGVEYDPSWRTKAGLNKETAATGKVANDDIADWRDAWRHFPGKVAYVWHGGLHGAEVEESLAAVKFQVRAQIVWVKTRPVLSRGAYHWQHEPAFYAAKDAGDDAWRFVPEHESASYAVEEGKTADWHGGRKQSTVWFIEHLKSDTGHGTQKPVECMARPIRNNSKRGDVIYEPFSGSGTTLIAAEQLERRCRAMELMPVYVDVAVKRWQEFTGREARLEADGKSFGETVARRAKKKAA